MLMDVMLFYILVAHLDSKPRRSIAVRNKANCDVQIVDLNGNELGRGTHIANQINASVVLIKKSNAKHPFVRALAILKAIILHSYHTRLIKL